MNLCQGPRGFTQWRGEWGDSQGGSGDRLQSRAHGKVTGLEILMLMMTDPPQDGAGHPLQPGQGRGRGRGQEPSEPHDEGLQPHRGRKISYGGMWCNHDILGR